MTVYVGWAAFDAQVMPPDGQTTPISVNVGWAEFDVQAAPFNVCVGWAELDCRSPSELPVPPFQPGGGVTRYHSRIRSRYEIPLEVDEDEEEHIIMQILMEIAAHELV